MVPKQLLSDDVLSQLSDTQLEQLWSVFVVDTSPSWGLDIQTVHDLNPRTGYVVVSDLQGKSRSRKLGNITLNWARLVETMPDILIPGMSVVAVAATSSPLIIMAAALGICNGLWKGTRVELTDAEASIMLALWTNGGKNRLFDEEEGRGYANEVRKSQGLSVLSMEQYRRSLSQLSRLRCVELRDGTARVRERVSEAR